MPRTEPSPEFIVFADRPSDAPVVNRVWRSHSEPAGVFYSMASTTWGMVVTRHEGRVTLSVRGPETRATLAECPAEGEWVSVQFKLGTVMPLFPGSLLRDRQDVTLPAASGRRFYLNGSAWEYPDFKNIDTLVARLVRQGLIVHAPGVQAALRGDAGDRSSRTGQRRIVQATGMTRGTIRQLERARRAILLLQAGAAIVDVADALGFADQAHFTRSSRQFVRQTPAQVGRGDAQLSLLFNTDDC
jgi:AraC-like DNA-binding protein